MQDVIMKPDPSHADTVVLKKTLSCSYPNLPFKEVIQKENEKLYLELQRSQANLDVGQCEVIEHLIGVTQVVASKSQHEQDSPKKVTKNSEPHYPVNSNKEIVLHESNSNKKTHLTSRLVFFLHVESLPKSTFNPKIVLLKDLNNCYNDIISVIIINSVMVYKLLRNWATRFFAGQPNLTWEISTHTSMIWGRHCERDVLGNLVYGCSSHYMICGAHSDILALR